jgi:hypothetical protein
MYKSIANDCERNKRSSNEKWRVKDASGGVLHSTLAEWMRRKREIDEWLGPPIMSEALNEK